MKAIIFDTHNFERPLFEKQNLSFGHELSYSDLRLNCETAFLARGFSAVCCFTHDFVDVRTLRVLKDLDCKLIALRTAGFNNVDLEEAKRLGLRVVRVPAYSPNAVAEHTIALLLALNRKICRASARVRDLNFSLDGLVGFDLHGKVVGVIGTGKIGSIVAQIFLGFGCHVIAFDLEQNPELEGRGVRYVSFDRLLELSDIISLHIPLNAKTRHLIDATAIDKMKKGVTLLNTGRGGLIETKSLIQGLKSGRISLAGLDVYEEEENIFLRDLSHGVLQDDVLARLMTFPNVLITAHQGFLTKEALYNIVQTTLLNLQQFERGLTLTNEITI